MRMGNTIRTGLHSPPRRGLRREDAAGFIGVSPSKFDELVKDGRVPKPFKIDGCVLWDILDLDAAFTEMKNNDGSRDHNPWDE